MDINVLKAIFTFIGGLGLFLYGMNTMADGFQKSAGGRMKKLLAVLTKNRFLAVAVGCAITCIIQSSSATTVMVVGFVNAELMDLAQAVGVIMGANVGTTITAWIVSMGEWGEMLKPDFFAPLIVGIGVAINMFAKRERYKKISEILIGFSVLFIGLSLMSGAIEPYRDAEVFKTLFQTLGRNPLLGILAGAVVTGVIQSSSASVGILQTLAMNGLVNYQAAIFITLGQNIGTCVTALISSVGAQKNAKRAAVIHVLFNTVGSVIFGTVMFVYFQFDKSLAASQISSVGISVFHTCFNLANTIILFPFANQLVKLSQVILKDGEKGEETTDKPVATMERRLDKRILENPTFAIEAAIKEVVYMGKVVIDNAKLAIDSLMQRDGDMTAKVFETEKDVDRLEKMLTEYLVKIDALSLTEEQHFVIKNLLYTVHDMERIGDHCENLSELADNMIQGELEFSEEGRKDMVAISQAVMMGLSQAVEARKSGNVGAVRKVVAAEDDVDGMEEEFREKHMQRLSEGTCNMESGLVFLDALTNLERISDHSLNIADYVKSEI